VSAAGGIGVVVIGRNEGERLRACLASLHGADAELVYVDSGSADGSVELARAEGARVVELDASRPFTAARARNAGLARLLADAPATRAVHFVDGDCQLAPGWLAKAVAALDARPDAAAVCGRRREVAPERSIYNRLCDVEWSTPPSGEVGNLGFGGDVMIRVAALQQAGGYRDSLIAGEDPELSARLRLHGWKILRLEEAMTLHDAAMTRFAQWWRRAVRAGHAYAEVAWLHRNSGLRLFVRELARALGWGLLLPLAALALATADARLALLALAAYPVQIVRVASGARRRGYGWRDALAWGAACVLGSLPQLVGVVRHAGNRLRGRRTALIEYRPPRAPGPA
jgi:GT2 family glycosyltransferase